MTIDFHAHWLPEELANALRKRSAPPRISMTDTGELFRMPVGDLPYDDIFSDLTARLQFMDKHGIQTQVLSLPCLFGLDSRPAAEALPLLSVFNDATAAAAKKNPRRFAGLASLPFDDVQLAAQEYRRARRELGLIGAIVPINFFLSIDGATALAPLLDMAEQEGGHLFLHPGRRPDEAEAMDAEGTNRYPDSVMARRQLEIQHQVAAAMVTLLWGRFPDKYQGFTLHVANMGGTLPLVVERMDYTSRLRTHEAVLPSDRVRNSSVLVDCSSMGPIAITAAVACFGSENILFGTDNPVYRSEWQLDAVQRARISDGDRRAILHDNGTRALQKWR